MNVVDEVEGALNPYALALKLAGIGIAVALVVTFAMSWVHRGQQIDQLTQWQNAVVISATDATVTPDAKGKRALLKPEQVPAAIATLKRNFDEARGTLVQASKDAEAAKVRADTADKALATATVVFEQRFSSAEKRIAALDGRKPAATPAQQCADMEADSKSAWEGWK